MIRHISAVTFAVSHMARSIEFYRKLGFELRYRGERAGLSSLKAGEAFVYLVASPGKPVVGSGYFSSCDVDGPHQALMAAGL